MPVSIFDGFEITSATLDTFSSICLPARALSTRCLMLAFRMGSSKFPWMTGDVRISLMWSMMSPTRNGSGSSG